ncbi:MAG: ABC-type transport auxiliary lipoprotein family protein [Rhizobium sp.]
MSAGLTACGSAPAKNDTFDLSAAATVQSTAQARNRQILVADPSALKALDSEQVMVRVSASEIQYLSNSQWSDRLPRMVQSKFVEAFENTGRLGGVGKPGQGLAIDFQLVTDIRAFEIDTLGADRAVVEISVKILNDRNGAVKAQKVFSASVPANGTHNEAYIAALDRAFAVVTGEIVDWTLRLI